MDFPLQIRFKTLAFAPQILVNDASGRLLCYVRQKMFRLREAVTVFADQTRRRPLYTIAADRVLDVNAQYRFTNVQGALLGAVRRRGMRSLWRAHYEIMRDGKTVMTVQEENPWTKVLDGLLDSVPVLGMFTGYMLHPAYRVTRADGTEVLRLEKQPAFLEGRYQMTALAPVDSIDEELAMLGLLMLVLLERHRG
jgi:uncharacterized protein YxjI